MRAWFETPLRRAGKPARFPPVPRSRKRVFWIGATGFAFAAGMAALVVALAPLYRSTSHFRVVEGEARVRYEPGAEEAAAVVAQALPAAIATVERGHGRPFTKPVVIHVCATTASFDRHGFGVSGAGGFVLNGRLFLSPKPQNTADRLPRLLTHELSHLHLEQQLGTLRGARQLPGWFKEGLAVYVAGGGGAETVSEAEARDAIARGRTFKLDTRGSLLFPQTAARDGLTPHLFYRESAMFVGFLARLDPGAFKRLLASIQDREAFDSAVNGAYGRDLAELWAQFTAATEPSRDPTTR